MASVLTRISQLQGATARLGVAHVDEPAPVADNPTVQDVPDPGPDYVPYGTARILQTASDPELMFSGPAGTGKTRATLEKIHAALLRHPGSRALALRKTLTSLTATAMVTFTKRVLRQREDGTFADGVTFFGGNKIEPPHFRYPNGSALVIGGLDNPQKILSSDYDIIYANQAEELSEAEWEYLTTRNRYGVMPYQQLLGDCNPDAPRHWIQQRSGRGHLRLLESRHEDNPVLFDQATGEMTAEGRRYIGLLDRLTGNRKLRLRHGRWVQAEGVVYEGWDAARHLVDRFPIPATWPRLWGVDFGFTNPFVWQAWAIDPDGRLYRYREIYRTQRLVSDHARDILAVSNGEPWPVAIICDHDAEDRATFERATGLATEPAPKAVSIGIQMVAQRLRPAADGRPRVFFMRDSLVEPDPLLVELRRPTCTEEEFDSYVWDVSANRRRGEQAVKELDHGMDTTRYVIAALDLPEQAHDELYVYDEPVLISRY